VHSACFLHILIHDFSDQHSQINHPAYCLLPLHARLSTPQDMESEVQRVNMNLSPDPASRFMARASSNMYGNPDDFPEPPAPFRSSVGSGWVPPPAGALQGEIAALESLSSNPGAKPPAAEKFINQVSRGQKDARCENQRLLFEQDDVCDGLLMVRCDRHIFTRQLSFLAFIDPDLDA